MTQLEKGDEAPELRYLRPSDGEPVKRTFRDRTTIVVFYPRAGSASCNSEIADFSDLKSRFDAIGVSVVAISPDGPAKLGNFAGKHGTQIELGSDPETENARRWGTWIEKTMYGRTFLGVERATFLVGPDRKIAETWRKVRVKGHSQVVLAAADKLREPE